MRRIDDGERTGPAVGGMREGSPRKRAAILDAARELFLRGGFARTTMDEIADLAGVSKRTIYDYYGDKRSLLLAVVEETLVALRATVHQAIEEHLVDVADLEAALVGFARTVTDSALGSADYAALMRLLSLESADVPDLHDARWTFDEPERAIAARFSELHRQGLLDAPSPRRAVDHFVALAVRPWASGRGLADTETQELIDDGVRVFLRAYAPTG